MREVERYIGDIIGEIIADNECIDYSIHSEDAEEGCKICSGTGKFISLDNPSIVHNCLCTIRVYPVS